jgi:hypothetical protein
MLVFVFLCHVVLYRPLRWADHSSKGVLPSVLIRLRNLPCEVAKVLRRTLEQLMMVMILIIHDRLLLSLTP